MELALVKEKTVNWLKDKVLEAGAKGTVVGLSGGIDSSVVAVLCQKAFPNNNLGIIMPCQSTSEDAAMAVELAQKFGMPYLKVDLSETYLTLLNSISVDGNRMAKANIKPRLRMTTLYYYAAQNNYLVIGTGNKSELFTGYFTKYGDGGVDVEPIGGLVKTQVRELARHLGVPESIVTRPPTAGLWEGQTDESEMQITYEELDDYILNGTGSARVKEIVERLHKKSAHKRSIPPTFEL